MKRWVITSGVVAVAAAGALTAWALIGSDELTYDTPHDAVIGTCHARSAVEAVHMNMPPIRGTHPGTIPVYWSVPHFAPGGDWVALVERTGGTYKVLQCKNNRVSTRFAG